MSMTASEHSGAGAPASPTPASPASTATSRDDQVREVSSHLELTVQDTADIVLAIAVARQHELRDETLTVTLDGAPVPVSEIASPIGGRLHRVAGLLPGTVVVDYQATVVGASVTADPTEAEFIEYLRPSRYCDSDRLAAIADTHFGELSGRELVDAVQSWVVTKITYAPGSSGVVDGALEAYLSRRGVCRDSAHLVVTFLRARNVPARCVSVYAPGLAPMDFHAVAEAYLDGHWHLVDGTGLAPRPAMVRIATGRDAADTAFLTVLSGRVAFDQLRVTAVAEPGLPGDDGRSLVSLS